jgi:general secretion pathway protein K
MKYPAPDYGKQRGSALVVVLLVLAVGMALVVPMYKEYILFIKRTSNSFAGEQAYAYLRGGEELAGILLLQDLEEDREEQLQRDDFSEVWAQQITPYALDEGGWLTGALEDLQGRFDINSLPGQPPQGQRFTAIQEQFIRLLRSLDTVPVDEQHAMMIAESVIDWLDADSNPRNLGAEDDAYANATPPYRAANRPMLSVSELRSVANITPEIFLALEPLLTVWSDGGKINIHTAPVQVLRSINSKGDLQPLSVTEGETLEEMRGEVGFESLEAMLESPVFADRELAPGLRAVLAENSSVFLFRGQAEVADRVSHLYSVIRRSDDQVQVIARGGGSL